MSLEHLLEHHGVKVTANRLLIARALEQAGRPLSLMELEQVIDSIDKSNIFRTLVAFKDVHLVHVLEGDPVRYELCHSHREDHDDDLHVHFYCTCCHKTYCLEEMPVPPVKAPEGYQVREASYLLRGICPECAGQPVRPA
ncbi:MAG: transcriptional repressor [Bacteroidales bacterium]|nr:transcriptional repressor [Bacteroidales bacterium]